MEKERRCRERESSNVVLSRILLTRRLVRGGFVYDLPSLIYAGPVGVEMDPPHEQWL
jgi:hypothetical protein